MTIRKRQVSSTGFYHVVVRGINREQIYDQQRERAYFKKIILKFLKKFNIQIYAYCIMSNHAHLIIMAELQELSSFMARILAEYAKYYNYKHNRNGHVFQNRFMSECIENERYFWNCLCYIHLNPVKAGMLKKAAFYKYSSMTEYCKENTSMLAENALLLYENRFGSYQEFENLHDKRGQEVYLDIKNEIEEQYLDIARNIAEDLFESKSLSILNQVFEEPSIREEYIQQIKRILKVSQRKAKVIAIAVKNLIENQ